MSRTKLSLRKFNVFSQFGGREAVCLNLSGDSLKIAYGKLYHTHKELLDLASYKIQGASNDEIADIIKNSLESLRLNNPEVIIVIPAHLAIIKNIEIPSLDAAEIRQIIDLQAGRHTPYSREEIIIDYINIGTYRENYTKVLLIIVTLSVIRRQIEILGKAGLNTAQISFAPESFADVCLNSLRLKHEGGVQTVLHIDTNFTDFVNVSKGRLIFVRSIPIGTQHLISEKERYQARFVEEVKKTIEAYQNEDIDRISMEIILAGAGEESLDLQNLLNSSIHVPVRRSFPYFTKLSSLSEILKNILASGTESFLDVASPLMSVNTAKVNLIPEEIKLRQNFEEKSREVVRFGISVMTVIILICFLFAVTLYSQNAYLKKLKEKYQPVLQAADHLQETYTRMQLIKQELKGRNLSLDVLGEVYGLIPTNVQLSGIRFSRQGKFSLTGNSRSMSIVFGFIDAMEESPYFKSVEPRRTTKRKISDEEEVVDFEITCILENTDGGK